MLLFSRELSYLKKVIFRCGFPHGFILKKIKRFWYRVFSRELEVMETK